ncbi:hypothetical protein [Nostoc sp. LPT]|nr:hypothetical protein [Nostoc sp. LPT]
MHPNTMLMRPSAMPMHPNTMPMRPSAMTMYSDTMPMHPLAMPMHPSTLKMLCFYAKLYLGRSREFTNLNGGL